MLVAEKNSNRIYYWIELKGSGHINKAYKQIINTIKAVATKPKSIHQIRIVSTRPYALDLRGRDYINLEKEIAKCGGIKGEIIIHSIKYTEVI